MGGRRVFGLAAEDSNFFAKAVQPKRNMFLTTVIILWKITAV